MSGEGERDVLAGMAVEPIRDGWVVGLGTGRAATRGVRSLAARVRAEGLDLTCVSTSETTQELARSLGLVVAGLGDVDAIDYLFDGADEVAPGLSMIKGAGGAMTRERIVASASRWCVYLVDRSKCVDVLGSQCLLPVEVLPFARAVVSRALEAHGYRHGLRQDEDGQTYTTDNGGLVLDVKLGRGEAGGHQTDDSELARWLDGLPGVIDHGLFLDEADEVLVEATIGSSDVERLVRNDSLLPARGWDDCER